MFIKKIFIFFACLLISLQAFASDEIKPKRLVRCFASNNIETNTSRIGKSRIEVRLLSAFPKSRGRINCTMAAKDGRWRWFGKQFVTK